jgi:hypothetical protein
MQLFPLPVCYANECAASTAQVANGELTAQLSCDLLRRWNRQRVVSDLAPHMINNKTTYYRFTQFEVDIKLWYADVRVHNLAVSGSARSAVGVKVVVIVTTFCELQFVYLPTSKCRRDTVESRNNTISLCEDASSCWCLRPPIQPTCVT